MNQIRENAELVLSTNACREMAVIIRPCRMKEEERAIAAIGISPCLEVRQSEP